MKENKELTNCPICFTEVPKGAFKERYISPYNQQEYKLYECPICYLHWWEPLKIIPEFYESEVFEGYTSFHEGIRSRIAQNHRAFFEYFPKEVKGKLLDIGCGDGVFLREAKGQGFEVWGIDFDKKSIETAKKSLGVDTLYAMSLEEFYNFAKERGLKFEVITFFEVLEHQDRPKEFLEMVKDLLAEGGYIAGSVPNRESIFHIDFHQKISSWIDHPPHHFLRFSKEALENTLKLTGFSDIRVYRLDFPKEELPAYVEKKLVGNKIDKLKIWLKGKALGNPRLANAIAVEDLDQIKPSFSAKFLLLLKRFRMLLFLPLSLPYLLKLKGNGINLYFQGRISK